MDELLIEKVREHELLYNQGLADYRDRKIRQEAWKDIGKELQIPASAAKHRWDKLRRCLCNARKRRRDDTTTGTLSKKKTLWKYEEQMSFLLPFSEIKQHSVSQAAVGLAFGPEDLLEEFEAEENTSSQYGHIDIKWEQDEPDNQYEEDDNPACNDIETTEDRHEEERIFPNQNQKIIVTPVYQIVNEGPRKRQKTSKATSLLDNLDDTDMFFLSMSRMTKKLPKVEQAQVKLALSNSVLWAEVRCNQQSFHQNLIQEQLLLSSPSPAPSNVQPDYSNN